MKRGVAPDGSHYYPAFPYTSYARMKPGDVADLWAYMRSLPGSDEANQPHQVGFPFNIRRGLGLWKLVFAPDPTRPMATVTGEKELFGQYLVEGPGHCGECHTPRSMFGGLDQSRWMGGGPNPEGKGRIPNITSGGKDTSSWSAADIAEYLKSGFTPDYDTAGGSMVDVIENTSRLSDEDRAAIAAYLKVIPKVESK